VVLYQLTDVVQEINGLMTYDRKPNADPAETAKILASDRPRNSGPLTRLRRCEAAWAAQSPGVRNPGGACARNPRLPLLPHERIKQNHQDEGHEPRIARTGQAARRKTTSGCSQHHPGYDPRRVVRCQTHVTQTPAQAAARIGPPA